jgi:peptide/nickel transport system substrate-binding protein
VPEENTRLAAVLTGQSQATQYVPYSGMAQIRANRNLRIVDNPAAFWTYFIGFKVDKAGVDDAAVRRAMVMAVDQEAISRDINFGETEPAYSYIHQSATDWNKAVDSRLIRTNVAEANRILDEAGWVRGADGFRSKNGVRLSPLAYGFTGSTWQKLMETVQGDLRKIGVDLRIQLFDATVAWGKLATQEFDLFGMSFPYITAGDALNLYFRSANAPTPNRMNWKDGETDRLAADRHDRRVRRRSRRGTTARCWPAGARGGGVDPALPRADEGGGDLAPRPLQGPQHLRLRLLQGPRPALHALM